MNNMNTCWCCSGKFAGDSMKKRLKTVILSQKLSSLISCDFFTSLSFEAAKSLILTPVASDCIRCWLRCNNVCFGSGGERASESRVLQSKLHIISNLMLLLPFYSSEVFKILENPVKFTQVQKDAILVQYPSRCVLAYSFKSKRVNVTDSN